MAIQLTLNPIKGFGILLRDAGYGPSLAEDFRTGMPYFVRTKRAAKHAAVFMAPNWGDPRVVAVEMHEGEEEPMFVIGEVVS